MNGSTTGETLVRFLLLWLAVTALLTPAFTLFVPPDAILGPIASGSAILVAAVVAGILTRRQPSLRRVGWYVVAFVVSVGIYTFVVGGIAAVSGPSYWDYPVSLVWQLPVLIAAYLTAYVVTYRERIRLPMRGSTSR